MDAESGDVHLPKIPKVEQNHRVTVTSINTATMDHYVTIEIFPDFKHREGLVKRGVRINMNEFSKGCAVLSERCGYRLLTPFNVFKYAASLHKATEDFMKNGDGGDEGRPAIQVWGPTPFKFNKEKYVAVSSKNGLKVFKLLGNRKVKEPKRHQYTPSKEKVSENDSLDASSPIPGCSNTVCGEERSSDVAASSTSAIPGAEQNLSDGLGSLTEYAVRVDPAMLPFVVNWSGLEVRDTEVNDKECLNSMLKIVDSLDLLKPTVPGLGVCLLSELGRFLLYNVLVDDDPEDYEEDSEDEDGSEPRDEEEEEEITGFKQMLLVLHSNGIDTGKSTCSDMCLRIYHGFKKDLQGTISFDSAKTYLEKGYPIVVDDYNNDEVGRVLVSRISKSCWGKAEINLKQHTYVPLSSLMFSTNEDITDLKVEGKNKDEIFRKFSVIDLGEDTMDTSVKNRNQKFADITNHSRNIRKYLPSFYGIMLRIHEKFISPQDFILYEDLTKYERLANILHNANQFHAVLNSFCEKESLQKPRSVEEKLSTFCLTNKSELSHKVRNPDQVIATLIKTESLLVPTTHDGERGLAFQRKSIENYPWWKNTLQLKKNGISVFSNVRSRQLGTTQNKKEARGVFIGYQWLKENTIEQVRNYVKVDNLARDESDEEEEMETEEHPVDTLALLFKKEFYLREKRRKQVYANAKESIEKLTKKSEKIQKASFPCTQCNQICRSKGGLTKHARTHKTNSK